MADTRVLVINPGSTYSTFGATATPCSTITDPQRFKHAPKANTAPWALYSNTAKFNNETYDRDTNLPRTSNGDIDWEKVGNDINLKDTKTWPEPPLEGNWQEVDPPGSSKKGVKSKNAGQKRLENERGDIARPHLPDRFHPKWHWDIKPGGCPNNEWQNWTPDGYQIPKGSIYGKDFNPIFMITPNFQENMLKRKLMENYQRELYKKQLKDYQEELKKYDEDMKEYQKEKDNYYKTCNCFT